MVYDIFRNIPMMSKPDNPVIRIIISINHCYQITAVVQTSSYITWLDTVCSPYFPNQISVLIIKKIFHYCLSQHREPPIQKVIIQKFVVAGWGMNPAFRPLNLATITAYTVFSVWSTGSSAYCFIFYA